MDTIRPRRYAAVLALVTMLLLALLPTVGRIAAAGVMGVSHAMHAGMEGAADEGMPSTAGDCDYCAIQSGCDAPRLLALQVTVALAGDRFDALGQLSPHDTRVGGLGARGPPATAHA